MPLFDTDTRDQLRQTYVQAWRKHLAASPLTPLESTIAEVILAHPEYQALVSDANLAVAFEPNASGGNENPFLHMALHLAVRDQVSIDRPPGVRELHRLLQARHGDPHGAEHALMEALSETLWQAQRDGRPPDEAHYLALARQRIEASGTPATRKR
jgi:hypothetical protein